MRQTGVLWSVLLCGGLMCGRAFAVDAQLMNLVMPDAKVLAGVNVTTLISSPLGQFLLTKSGGQLPPGVVAANGFNPLQDVTEILVASAADPSNPSGLVMVRGTFPVDKMSALLAAVPGGANWKMTTYGGATLISGAIPNGKVAYGAAFLGNSIAIFGDVPSVQAAIDRSTGTNSIDPALMLTVNQLSGSEDNWLVSSASLGSLVPANAGIPTSGPAATVAPLLKNILSFNGGIKFGDSVALTGEAVANSPQNAAALNAVLKLGLILAGSATGGAAGNQQVAGLMQLLQTVQVTANGSAVDLSLSIPESQIESLVNSTPAVIASVRKQAPSAVIHNGN